MSDPDANVIEFDKYQPSTAQVLTLLTRARNRIAVINSKGAMQVAERRDGEIFVQQDAELIAELHNQLAALAQTQAGQQVRLRALVIGWRAEAKQFEFFAGAQYADGSRNAYGRCADELEAVLGGKENE